MQALPKLAEFELPSSLVRGEAEQLFEQFQESYAKQGQANQLSLTPNEFVETAKNRVRLGLLTSELVRQHGLQAKPEQVRKHLELMARDYGQPGELMRHYLGNAERMREVEALVVEQSVVDWVLAHGQVTDRTVTFNELMAGDGVSEGASE
jgi:trigger factor